MPLGAQDIQYSFNPHTHELAVSATFAFPDGSSAPWSMTLKGYQFELMAGFVAMAPGLTLHGPGGSPDPYDVARVLIAVNIPFAWAGPAPTPPPKQTADDLVFG